MANDLSIDLGANVDNAVSNLKRAGNSVQDLRNQSNAAAVSVDRAGQSFNNFGRQADSIDKSVRRMNWGMMAGSLAIGFQDAASVLSNGGSFGMALNAAGNNIIQFASMINPLAGGVTAIGIAAMQLAPLFSKAKEEAAKFKEEIKAAKDLAAAFKIPTRERGQKAEQARDELQTLTEARDSLQQRKAELEKKFEDSWKEPLSESRAVAEAQAAVRNGYLRQAQQIDEQIKEIEKERTEKKRLIDTIAPDAVPFSKEQRQATDIWMAEDRAKRQEADAEKKKVEDDWNDLLKSIPGILQNANDETVAANTRKAEEAAEKRERENRNHIEIGARLTRDVMAERRRNNPMMALEDEAYRLKGLNQWGSLSDQDMRTSLQRQVQQMFGQGPQLSSGVVRGSVEEVSLRNRAEAQQRNEQFISKQVDKIIAALPDFIPLPTYGLGASG